MDETTESYADRKKREYNRSRGGMQELLATCHRRVIDLDRQAIDMVQDGASWSDDQGRPQKYVGPSFTGAHAPDLLLRSNRKSVAAIHRACLKAINTIENLQSVLRDNSKAMPENLPEYLDKIMGELPPIETIKTEIVRKPKIAAPAEDNGSAKS